MTNEQLALLLEQYAQRLHAALTGAMDNLPAEALKTRKSLIGGDYAYAPALNSVYELAEEIEKSVGTLRAVSVQK
jgi:hypothetical protein